MHGKIFVAAHKDFLLETELPDGYVPIQAGADFSEDRFFELSDNTGLNISSKNKTFCELTAIYWIWKNCRDLDYIGLVHYRRYFTSRFFGKRILESDEIEKDLDANDIILPFPFKKNVTVREQFKSDRYVSEHDFEICISVLLEKYSALGSEVERFLDRDMCSLYNMFIMRAGEFNAYCTWLFDILFEVEKRVDMTGYTDNQKRLFGYLSERLLNFWVMVESPRIKYRPIVKTDDTLREKVVNNIHMMPVVNNVYIKLRKEFR